MAPYFFILAFRATYSVWRSKLRFHFNIKATIFFRLAFRVIVHFPFGVQSHISLSTSRSLFFCSAFRATPSVWHSEPCFVSFDVQSPYIIHFGDQSHYIFSLAFRATSSFGIQSHYIFISAFKVITSFISTFRATSSLRHSKPLLVFYLAFRTTFSVRHSKSPCLSFIRPITICLHFGVQSHWACSFKPF